MQLASAAGTRAVYLYLYSIHEGSDAVLPQSVIVNGIDAGFGCGRTDGAVTQLVARDRRRSGGGADESGEFL